VPLARIAIEKRKKKLERKREADERWGEEKERVRKEKKRAVGAKPTPTRAGKGMKVSKAKKREEVRPSTNTDQTKKLPRPARWPPAPH